MSALVEMRGITKIYPNGVLANDRVDFSVESGEIHALVGENGAGKSTLMKLLYGMEALTEGQVFLRGNPVTIRSPLNAISLGIGMVHQSFMLIPSFTIAQNIVLGDEPKSRGFVDQQKALEITQQLAKHYGLEVDAEARVDSVPVGMRQRVEILKALRRGAEVLILDEPTAVLTPQEIKDLFIAVRQLTQEGKTVIFITHKLREVKEISDRVTVMRQARAIGTLHTADASEEQIARMMVGREVFMVVDKPPVDRGEVVLEVDDLTYVSEAGNAKLRGVSLKVHAGEILGVAGVEGNGQTELVEVITGLQSASGGSVSVDSKDISNRDTRTVREAYEKRGGHKLHIGREPDSGQILHSAFHQEGHTRQESHSREWPRTHRALQHSGSQPRGAHERSVRGQYTEGGGSARAISQASPADRGSAYPRH